MKVLELNLEKYLSTTQYDPSPHRFRDSEVPVSDRKMSVEYTCEGCKKVISFKTASFEKHCDSEFSNLEACDNELFRKSIKEKQLQELSFLDFSCPSCQQATKILFEGGPSGYWGMFQFKIKTVLILKG